MNGMIVEPLEVAKKVMSDGPLPWHEETLIKAIEAYEAAKHASMPQGVVERVAIAICPWVGGRKQNYPPEVVWANLTEASQRAYREQAKAALAALPPVQEASDMAVARVILAAMKASPDPIPQAEDERSNWLCSALRQSGFRITKGGAHGKAD